LTLSFSYDENGLDKTLEDEVMNIEIHDAALEAKLQKLLQATGSGSVEEVLRRFTGDSGRTGCPPAKLKRQS
jgi:hypothetical protein